MKLPYSDTLNIACLSRIFDNTSECYKFFWFQSILEKVNEGMQEMKYEDLVDEMVCSAWYMVNAYHLNLGPADTLEKLIVSLQKKYPHLSYAINKRDLLVLLHETEDAELQQQKRQLTRYVPYRLQIPFVPEIHEKDLPLSERKQIEFLNSQPRALYYYGELKGLMTEIRIHDDWVLYFQKNYEIISGWLELKLIQYLQKRNPNVPGISEKLYPPQERKLADITKYWKLILTIQPMHEIYGQQLLHVNDLSIDHFVPWSYVAHDELWNLCPTTKQVNSSKSNSLPDWDLYFSRLAQQEYSVYQLVQKNENVHDAFMKCVKKHVNSEDIQYRLYREGLCETEFQSELESVLLPVYESAQNCGFKEWKYEK